MMPPAGPALDSVRRHPGVSRVVFERQAVGLQRHAGDFNFRFESWLTMFWVV